MFSNKHPHQRFSAVTDLFEDSKGSFLNEDNQGDREFRAFQSIVKRYDCLSDSATTSFDGIHQILHSAGYLGQKIILPRRSSKKL